MSELQEVSEIGIVQDVIVTEMNPDWNLIERISKTRSIDKDLVRKMLRYNILTDNQVAEMIGKAVNTIIGYKKPQVKKGQLDVKLSRCYPFDEVGGSSKVFVFRDEKLMELLTEHNQ